MVNNLRWQYSHTDSVKTLTWQDFADAAHTEFKDWNAPTEYEWLENAWEYVVNAGLANFSNDQEFITVVIRLIAVFGFYDDFCSGFGGSGRLPKPGDIALKLNVTVRDVMLLIGQNGGLEDYFRDYFVDENNLLESGLIYVCTDASTEILTVLLSNFRSAEWLFATLLNSIGSETPEWWSEDYPNSEADTLFGNDDSTVWQAAWYGSLQGKWQSINEKSKASKVCKAGQGIGSTD